MPAKSISGKRALREWSLYVLLLPSLLLVGIFAYFPAASAIYHSFFDWSGGQTKEFIRFENFHRIWEDGTFWESFITIAILGASNVIKMIPSIAIAVLIHRVFSERMQYFYRILVVLPMVVPQLVSLFVWKFIYDPNLGPLNHFLQMSGLKHALVAIDNALGLNIFYQEVPINWLGTPELVIPSLIFWGFPWLGAVGVLVYLAGLQGIDKELYEASEMDGCGPIMQFFYIELPLVLTQIRLMLILLIIGTLQGYGHIYLLLGESGGPGGAGMVPGLWMFNRAFYAGEFGYACALGIILFFFILGLTWINNRYVRVEK